MCADRGRRSRPVSFEAREKEMDAEIAGVFGEQGITVFRETQVHGPVPDFQRTEAAIRRWLDEPPEGEGGSEARAGQLKALHKKLVTYAEGTYKFLTDVWEAASYSHGSKGCPKTRREEPLCTPVFVVVCLGYNNVLRKGCLLYCIHRIRAPQWMSFSLAFILLSDLLRRMHRFVGDVKAALRLSGSSYDFMVPPRDDSGEGEGAPKYWWGDTELEEANFGHRDVRTSLLFPAGAVGVPDPDVKLDDSGCAVM